MAPERARWNACSINRPPLAETYYILPQFMVTSEAMNTLIYQVVLATKPDVTIYGKERGCSRTMCAHAQTAHPTVRRGRKWKCFREIHLKSQP